MTASIGSGRAHSSNSLAGQATTCGERYFVIVHLRSARNHQRVAALQRYPNGRTCDKIAAADVRAVFQARHHAPKASSGCNGFVESSDANGRRQHIRAVDAEGEVLDVLVQSKRNEHAALKLMRKPLRKYALIPELMVTDDLRSYDAATLDLGIDHLRDRGRWKNNRTENSHQPTFDGGSARCSASKSACAAQKFLSAHAAVCNTSVDAPSSARGIFGTARA